MQRDVYGLHMPMRQLMTRKLVAYASVASIVVTQRVLMITIVQNPHMPAYAASKGNFHLDILMGRDTFIDESDVFEGMLDLISNLKTMC